MPPIALLAPIALPVAAALIAAAFGPRFETASRATAAVGAWAALAAVAILWLAVRSTQEVSLGPLGFGASFELRLDGVAVVFSLFVLVPAAVLLTLQRRGWQESTVAALAVAAAVLALESGNLIFTAVGGCTAATLAVVQLDIEDFRAARPSWPSLMAPWVALAWAAVTVQIQSGTVVYSAVPVSALTWQIFGLIAIASLLGAGMVPWRGWASMIWLRPSLRGAGLTAATLLPVGVYLLVRAYEMGDGHYPQTWLNLVLAAWGVLVGLGAAARAQAAASRSEYLAEIVPGLAGFALMAIAIGSALGVVAGLVLLAAASLVVAALPLLPDRRGLALLLVTAAAAGMPPGLVFGGRILALAAAFEAGNAFGLVGVAGAATWLLGGAAAARSVGLPAGRRRQVPAMLAIAAAVLGAVVVASGPALAALTSLATGAVAGVISLPAGGVGADATSIVTVSAVIPAVALLGPALVLGVGALLLSQPGPATATAESRAPLFSMAWAVAAAGLWDRVKGWSVPEQYRSLFSASALERAATSARPALWLASLVALALAVAR